MTSISCGDLDCAPKVIRFASDLGEDIRHPELAPYTFAMAPPEASYFTCTLGEAASGGLNRPLDAAPFSSIIDVIDRQAESNASSPAIGFAAFKGEDGNRGRSFKGHTRTCGYAVSLS